MMHWDLVSIPYIDKDWNAGNQKLASVGETMLPDISKMLSHFIRMISKHTGFR